MSRSRDNSTSVVSYDDNNSSRRKVEYKIDNTYNHVDELDFGENEEGEERTFNSYDQVHDHRSIIDYTRMFNISDDRYIVLCKGRSVRVCLKKHQAVRGHVDMHKQYLPIKLRFKKEFSKVDFYVDFGRFPQPLEYSLLEQDTNCISIPEVYSHKMNGDKSIRFVIRARRTMISDLSADYLGRYVPSRLVYKTTQRGMEMDSIKKQGIDYKEFLEISLNRPSSSSVSRRNRSVVLRENRKEGRAGEEEINERNRSMVHQYYPSEVRNRLVCMKEEREERLERAKMKRTVIREKSEAEVEEKVRRVERRRLVERMVLDWMLEEGVRRARVGAWVRMVKLVGVVQQMYLQARVATRIAAWKESVSVHRKIVEVIRPKIEAWKASKKNSPETIAGMTIRYLVNTRKFDVRLKCYECLQVFLKEATRCKLINVMVFSTVSKYTKFQNRWRNHLRRRDEEIGVLRENFFSGIKLMRTKGGFSQKEVDYADDYLRGIQGERFMKMIFNIKLREYLVGKVQKMIEVSEEKKKKRLRYESLMMRKKQKTFYEELIEEIEEEKNRTKRIPEPSLDNIKNFSVLKHETMTDPEAKLFTLLDYKRTSNPESNISRRIMGRLSILRPGASFEEGKVLSNRLNGMNNMQYMIEKNSKEATKMSVGLDPRACIDILYYLIQYLTPHTATGESGSKNRNTESLLIDVNSRKAAGSEGKKAMQSPSTRSKSRQPPSPKKKKKALPNI